MFNNNIQYINIVKTQQNIKIDYEVLKNNQVIKNEQSIFLLDDNSLSLDTNFKLQTLEQNTPNSYITAICEDENQTIVKNEDAINISNTNIYFDHSHKISLENTKIEESKKFFCDGNIDYLISPFSILQNKMSDNLEEESLNIFILNNNIYAIILDKNKRYSLSSIKQLTSFQDIKKSNFYNDDIVEQKLYEEVYALELNENISDITKEFYEVNQNSDFLKSINIYYNIKQLNNEQLDLLNENLMINVKYEIINIDEILYKISKKPSIKKLSFIKPREKKSTLSFAMWILIALISTALAIAVVYMIQVPSEVKVEVKKEVKKIVKKEVKKKEEILLPNHIEINEHHVNHILDIFNTISDDSTLKEIQLQKDESTLVYNYLKEDSYEKVLKAKLLKIYENSENVLTSKNNRVFTAIISNTNILDKLTKIPRKKYKLTNETKYLNKKESTKMFTSLFNKETSIKQISSMDNKYNTQQYKIVTLVSTPNELFEVLKKINETNYSVELSFPIEFAKVNDKLEISFKLKFHQNIPKKLSK